MNGDMRLFRWCSNHVLILAHCAIILVGQHVTQAGKGQERKKG